MIISDWWFRSLQAENLLDRNSKNPMKHWITRNFLSRCDFSKHEILIAMKNVWIIQYLASDAAR